MKGSHRNVMLRGTGLNRQTKICFFCFVFFSRFGTYLGAIITVMTELLKGNYSKQHEHENIPGLQNNAILQQHDPYDKYTKSFIRTIIGARTRTHIHFKA